MEIHGSLKRLITSINERFEVETSYPYVLNALEILFQENKPLKINRIQYEMLNSNELVGIGGVNEKN